MSMLNRWATLRQILQMLTNSIANKLGSNHWPDSLTNVAMHQSKRSQVQLDTFYSVQLFRLKFCLLKNRVHMFIYLNFSCASLPTILVPVRPSIILSRPPTWWLHLHN